MCGRATLAIDVSSTSMNVASITAIATTHGLTAARGAADAYSSGSFAGTALIFVGGLCPPVMWNGAEKWMAEPALLEGHLRLDRHAGAERIFVAGGAIEHDLDRHPVHDLHVVARCVLGGKEAEPCARAALHAV